MTLTDADLDRIEARVWAETVGRDPVTRINEATSVLDLSVPRLEQVHADVCSLVAEVRRLRARIAELEEALSEVESLNDQLRQMLVNEGYDIVKLEHMAALASAGDAGREGE